MEKAFTWTLCFNDSRISQVQNSVKSKATVDAPWMCYIHIFCLVVWIAIGVPSPVLVHRMGHSGCYIYIHSAWGFRVARFNRVGQCESL